MKIIVDAMGGDNAPLAPVQGALEAHKRHGIDILLVGRAAEILRCVEECGEKTLPKGVELARRLREMESIDFPQETAIGALGLYVSNETVSQFQPMNINFGIIPPLDHRVKGKRNKNAELSQRSLALIDAMKEEVLR